MRFRVGNVYKNAQIVVSCGERQLIALKKKVLAPGEMEQVILKKADLEQIPDLSQITIEIRTQEGEA